MQKTQKEILEDFARGRECAEQVCMMLAGRLGDDADTLRRSAVAFGSGMGCAETCGCITAAMLVLGALYAPISWYFLHQINLHRLRVRYRTF